MSRVDRKVYIDPPSGWRHGFPAVYDPVQDGSVRDWLISKGYPEKDIDFALKYCRVWPAEDLEDEE